MAESKSYGILIWGMVGSDLAWDHGYCWVSNIRSWSLEEIVARERSRGKVRGIQKEETQPYMFARTARS